MDGTSGCFPMEAHIAYANKIARTVIHDNRFDGEKVDVIMKNLSESEVADLNSYFLLQHLMKRGKQSFTKQFRKQMPQSKGRSNIN